MQDQIIREGDIVAIMDTSLWEIKIKLFLDKTPKTCENFIKLSQTGYYDWIIFHRVIPDFMIQGWDPTWTGMWGKSIFGKNFKDEFDEELVHIKWAISMANAGPNTNWSQFFIVQAPATHFLNYKHSVFGQTVEWLDVIDTIATQKTDRNDKPLFDVVINGIQIKKFENGELVEFKM